MRDRHPKSQNGTHLYKGEKWGKYVAKSPVTSAKFALIDVKQGRGPLAKLVGEHRFKVPVKLSGYIIGTWSGDDGTSIEFEIDVRQHSLGNPEPHTCNCVRCQARERTPMVRRGK